MTYGWARCLLCGEHVPGGGHDLRRHLEGHHSVTEEEAIRLVVERSGSTLDKEEKVTNSSTKSFLVRVGN